jgi:hypothetical protein
MLLVIVSMQWGFSTTLAIGALCYAAAGGFSLLTGSGPEAA